MSRRAAPHRGIDAHYGDAEDDRPSKSELKRQSHALQTLGEDLAALSVEALGRIEMSELLRDAIVELQRTRSHEGRRRQLQYVGKLMRSADADALREAVAATQIGTAQATLLLHEAERWRAELIASDDALTAWLAEHPDSDAQQLRSLVRAARRDARDSTPADGLAPRQPRSFRELFLFIRPQLQAARAPGDEGSTRSDDIDDE